MFANSEQERLNAWYNAYENIKYNISKKRREKEITREMVAAGSGVNVAIIQKIESSISESDGIRLTTLINVCLYLKMSIQEVFEMRPEIDSEETAEMLELLKKFKVAPSELPERVKADFANYIAGDKFVDRDVFAAWHRIYALKNHAEPKEKLDFLLAGRLKNIDVGKKYKYDKKLQIKMYEFIKSIPDKEFTLRNFDAARNEITRIK